MKHYRVSLLGVVALVTATAACSSSTDFKPIEAKKSLDDLKSSNLVVVPTTVAEGYSLTAASADTGGGSQPLSGAGAAKATRFAGQFAKNGSESSKGGYLNWCAARPADFKKVCGEVADTVYFKGRVDDMMVVASGADYPSPPRTASAFTKDFTHAAWVK